jgi:hypothetical protein
MKGGLRGILHAELNLLRHRIASEESRHFESAVNPSGDTRGADEISVRDHASVDWRGAEIAEQAKSRPMRGGPPMSSISAAPQINAPVYTE